MRRYAAVAFVAAVAGTVFMVAPGSGKPSGTGESLVLNIGEGWEAKTYDLGKKGPSRGDISTRKGPFFNSGGDKVGTGFARCQKLKQTAQGFTTSVCDEVLELGDSTITYSGLGKGGPAEVTNIRAVTGGTGSFEGASGTVTITEEEEPEYRIVYTFNLFFP